MSSLDPNSCPICRQRDVLFYQYPLICHKCWPGICNDVQAAQQLQMRLTFWAAIKTNKAIINGG